MKHTIYIDHPDDPGAYDCLPGEMTGDAVVSRKLGVKAKFVCNSYAKISKGDVYGIVFSNAEDATAFVLGCKLPLVDSIKVNRYLYRHK